jgi:hypothetical protein
VQFTFLCNCHSASHKRREWNFSFSNLQIHSWRAIRRVGFLSTSACSRIAIVALTCSEVSSFNCVLLIYRLKFTSTKRDLFLATRPYAIGFVARRADLQGMACSGGNSLATSRQTVPIPPLSEHSRTIAGITQNTPPRRQRATNFSFHYPKLVYLSDLELTMLCTWVLQVAKKKYTFLLQEVKVKVWFPFNTYKSFSKKSYSPGIYTWQSSDAE